MCGIFGYLNAPGEKGKTALLAMSKTLLHRGPDDSDLIQFENAGLGHTRLSIIDLPGGRQPLRNEDNRVVLVCNGEIYNFQELRQGLLARGHVFRTRTDSEVIVHLYEEKGVALLQELDGMFAFGLYDGNRRQLLLARDRIGKKPLHITRLDHTLYFASEIKALLALPGFTRKLNPEALNHYLTLQYVPDTHAIFQGIEKVQPGEYRLLEAEGNGPAKRYWSLTLNAGKASFDEAVHETRQRIDCAVRKRLVADVPLGVFLSGGIDSSVVTAAAALNSDKPVNTFSIGFREVKFDELPKSRVMTQRYGTRHETYVMTLPDVRDSLSEILEDFDEPFADPSALPYYSVCKLARAHMKVALTGDGGDEGFAGYQRYALDAHLRKFAWVPKWIPNAASALAGVLRVDFRKPLGRDYTLALKRLGQAFSTPEAASILRWGSYFSAADKACLFRPEIASTLGLDSSRLWLESLHAVPAGGADPLNRTLFTDLSSYAPGDYLVKADRLGMRMGLELRSPLLDTALLEYLFSLSGTLKTRGSLKALLKAAYRDDLPAEVLKGGKQGFSIPVGLWMQEAWLSKYKDLAQQDSSLTREFFNWDYVETLMREHRNRRNDHGKKLYALLCLELWNRKWRR